MFHTLSRKVWTKFPLTSYPKDSKTLADEWVDGKFLPKGTILFVNVWGLHHDESKFENHDVFDPDRYKGNTMLAADSANSADYENRDHYGYGPFTLTPPTCSCN